MKKILISFLALICLCSFASAQRIEIFGGYSYGSEVGAIPSFSLPINTRFNAPTYPVSCDYGKSAMTLGVNVRILKKISIGLSWTGLNKGVRQFALLNAAITDRVNQSSNTVLFNVKYDWLKIWRLGLYSRVGLGAVFFGDPEYDIFDCENLDWGGDKPESCKRLAWQASLVGVEYRPLKWIGVFAEGGLGRQGALLAGLKVFL